MTLVFDKSGAIQFDSKFDGIVRLRQDTWERHIVCRPERAQLKFNSDKVATTLINPDHCRESAADGPAVRLYYKEFSRWKMSEALEVPIFPMMRYLAVVLNTRKKLILTIYPTGRIKAGKTVN